jgi:hypothetical protein
MGQSTEIVLSFVPPDKIISEVEAALAKQFADRIAGIGEPWLTRPSPTELQKRLREMGLESSRTCRPKKLTNSILHHIQMVCGHHRWSR